MALYADIFSTYTDYLSFAANGWISGYPQSAVSNFTNNGSSLNWQYTTASSTIAEQAFVKDIGGNWGYDSTIYPGSEIYGFSSSIGTVNTSITFGLRSTPAYNFLTASDDRILCRISRTSGAGWGWIITAKNGPDTYFNSGSVPYSIPSIDFHRDPVTKIVTAIVVGPALSNVIPFPITSDLRYNYFALTATLGPGDTAFVALYATLATMQGGGPTYYTPNLTGEFIDSSTTFSNPGTVINSRR